MSETLTSTNAGNGAAPRVLLYARYSTDKQNPMSIEDQLRVCRDFAAKQGWTVIGEFHDADISGRIADRPGYQAMLRTAEAEGVDVILAQNLDRLTRDTEEAARLYKWTKFHKTELWTSHDGRLGLVHIGMHGMMSSLFLEMLADRTREGLRGVAERGGHPGGRVFGYRNVPKPRVRTDRNERAEGGTLEIDPDEAAVVLRIFRLYADGAPAARIARVLNDEDVPTPRGGVWRVNTILGDRKKHTGILNNQLYVGIRLFGKREWVSDPENPKRRIARMVDEETWIVVPVPELAIVPTELWDAVKARQAKLDERMRRQAEANGSSNKRKGLGAARRNQHLLTDVLRCGACGGKMTGGNPRYLKCSTAKETGGARCDHGTLYPKDEVEGRVLDALQRDLMREEAMEDFIAAYNDMIAERNASHNSDRKAQERKLGEVTRQIENLVGVLAAGQALGSIVAKIEQLEARKAELEDALAAPRATEISLHPKAVEAYRRFVRRLADMLYDPERRGAAIDGICGLIDKLVLHPRPDRGEKAYELELEGGLRALLEASGISGPEAARIDAASRESGQLVAGGGFEPPTFRL